MSTKSREFDPRFVNAIAATYIDPWATQGDTELVVPAYRIGIQKMDEDSEESWQDECFKLIRINVGVIAEYSSLVKEDDSPAAWALVDLRSLNHDLLQAIEDADENSTKLLLLESRVLLIELLRLVR